MVSGCDRVVIWRGDEFAAVETAKHRVYAAFRGLAGANLESLQRRL